MMSEPFMTTNHKGFIMLFLLKKQRRNRLYIKEVIPEDVEAFRRVNAALIQDEDPSDIEALRERAEALVSSNQFAGPVEIVED